MNCLVKFLYYGRQLRLSNNRLRPGGDAIIHTHTQGKKHIHTDYGLCVGKVSANKLPLNWGEKLHKLDP